MMHQDDHAKAADQATLIDDAALDAVTGGFNPQPDPPREIRPVTYEPIVIAPIRIVTPGR